MAVAITVDWRMAAMIVVLLAIVCVDWAAGWRNRAG